MSSLGLFRQSQVVRKIEHAEGEDQKRLIRVETDEPVVFWVLTPQRVRSLGEGEAKSSPVLFDQ